MASEHASRSPPSAKPITGASFDMRTLLAAGIPDDLYEAITKMDNVTDDDTDPRLECAKFYRIQSNQTLGNKQIYVSVYIEDSLDQSWISPLTNGMKAINTAAPGLNLYKATDTDANIVVRGNSEDGCWAQGNIILHKPVKISLDETWPDSGKRGTAIHEMLHALGFQHEHKRRDGEKYLKYDIAALKEEWKPQYEVSKFSIGLTRFDPHSIMMYPLSEVLDRKAEGDPVWETVKVDGKRSQVLSELDKVALNLFYRPVEHENYTPKESPLNGGLMYCGRHTVNTDDGVCGPKQGANCPACRVLETEKSKKINKRRKWQGWSGLVYCGKTFQKPENDHDGYCGPNNGPQCDECHMLLYQDN